MALSSKFFIYTITNHLTGKVYVGSTTSVQNRWKKHRWQLRSGIHPNEYLQRAWLKDGESNFKFGIISESFGTKFDKQSLEDFHIEKFDTRNPLFGYNLKSANLTDVSLPMVTRQKISAALTNNPKKCQKIVQYEVLTGKFIREWPSSMEIKRSMGSQSGVIQCCLKNPKYQSVMGFGWAYASEYYRFDISRFAKPNYIPHFKTENRYRRIRGTALKTQTMVEFNSITEGAKRLNVSVKCLQRAVQFQGKYGRKSYKGYIWEYIY